MILKEHPVKYTAIQIRRSIDRLEAFCDLNLKEAVSVNVDNIILKLKDVYNEIPEEFRK